METYLTAWAKDNQEFATGNYFMLLTQLLHFFGFKNAMESLDLHFKRTDYMVYNVLSE